MRVSSGIISETFVRRVSNAKLLFLFSRSVKDEVNRISAHAIPSEILYGVVELINNGWNITISDARHQGLFGRVNRHIKSAGFNLINFATIKDIVASDVVVVKGEFSLMTTVVCRILGKKIIYKDAMFRLPKWFWRNWSAYINLRLASATIAYSEHQARLWEQRFKLEPATIKTLCYSLDAAFYPDFDYLHNPSSYVLSVGRDPGRDYRCLARAVNSCQRKTELVTLPYLVNEEIKNNNNIHIRQRIPYQELFQLYQNCLCAVVPLAENLTYASGIRGVLESLVLGIPTIATRTPVLTQYFVDSEDLIFIDANDDQALSRAIEALASNAELARRLSKNAKAKARCHYNMLTYTRDFEAIINEVIDRQ